MARQNLSNLINVNLNITVNNSPQDETWYDVAFGRDGGRAMADRGVAVAQSSSGDAVAISSKDKKKVEKLLREMGRADLIDQL